MKRKKKDLSKHYSIFGMLSNIHLMMMMMMMMVMVMVMVLVMMMIVATARKFYIFVFCLQFNYISLLPNVALFMVVFVLEISLFE